MRISDWSSDVCSSDLFATANSTGLTFGLVFVLVGLAFKIAAVPFHMWTPDVYEGAPTPVTAYFASALKVAAMALIVRVAVEAMGPVTIEWRQIVIFARSEEHTSELQSLMRISYAVFCLKKKKYTNQAKTTSTVKHSNI